MAGTRKHKGTGDQLERQYILKIDHPTVMSMTEWVGYDMT